MGRSDVEIKSEEQMKNLAAFQTKALFHAISFPNVQRIVYSTCSINCLENECVIEDVMTKRGDGFEVVEKVSIGDDFTRGSDEYKFGKHGVYFHSEKDQTTGFFVCVIERSKESSESKK
jgi:25S rRNA (cytosine2278-C5)-methyltransferase